MTATRDPRRDPIDPVAAVRAELLTRLRARIRSWNVSQAQAAMRLGISRPNLNMLLLGRRTFSIEALLGFAAAAGLTVEIRIAADACRGVAASVPEPLAVNG